MARNLVALAIDPLEPIIIVGVRRHLCIREGQIPISRKAGRRGRRWGGLAMLALLLQALGCVWVAVLGLALLRWLRGRSAASGRRARARGQTAVITGGSSGIGLHRGAAVGWVAFAVCRPAP